MIDEPKSDVAGDPARGVGWNLIRSLGWASCRSGSGAGLSYRNAFLLYLAIFAGAMSPYLFRGEIIAESRHRPLYGLEPAPDPTRIENAFFGDYSLTYVPETEQLL